MVKTCESRRLLFAPAGVPVRGFIDLSRRHHQAVQLLSHDQGVVQGHACGRPFRLFCQRHGKGVEVDQPGTKIGSQSREFLRRVGEMVDQSDPEKMLSVEHIGGQQ